MSTLRITHTSEDGTLLEGSVKGDGAWEAIKTAQASWRIRGWRYFPSIRAIGLSHSRDRVPLLGLIETTAQVLREAGFEVEVQVDGAPRAMTDAEADRAERMDDRADALRAKAARLSDAAEARAAEAQRLAEVMQGEPIKQGHHSAARHTRDAARMEGNMRASIELEDQAAAAAGRAEAAEQHMARRENPRRVMRRVEKLRADLRRVQRGLEGHTRNFLRNDGSLYAQDVTPPASGLHREQLLLEKAHLEGQVGYWQEFLDTEIAAGRFNPVDLSAIKPGDRIKYWRGWSTVVKVNRVTVSVESGYSWPDKVKVDEITGHRTAAEVLASDEAAQAAAQTAIDLDELRCASND
jgi:uncharacterized protein DUF3560